MHETLADFWRHYPALLYGIAALLGSATALSMIWPPIVGLIAAFLLLPLFTQNKQARWRAWLAMLVAAASCILTHERYQFPENVPLKNGIADVEITSVSALKTPFGPIWGYEGTMRSFLYNGQIVAKGFPVRLSMPRETRKEAHLERPLIGMRYQFKAHLKETSQGGYALTPVRGEPWLPVEHINPLAEWRFAAKSALHQHLQTHIADPHVVAFLTGIITGEFDDRVLAYELGRFGLQHLMAISGLHFSILATLIGFGLGLVFSRTAASLLLIACMTLYFIFLGDSPSVTRAWIASVLALSTIFFERHSLALNSLGVGLLIVILWNPLAMQDIGFQFSFGVTAAILLWFSPCEKWLQTLFPKRSLSQAISMDIWDQHGYCFLHFLRQALALSIAVNLVALPITLFHFHKFPLMGLVYNLFFPALVSVSMLLLLMGSFFALIFPWLGAQLHALNEIYTQALLNLTFHLPKNLDAMTWRTASLTAELLLILLTAIFAAGIFFRHRLTENDIG